MVTLTLILIFAYVVAGKDPKELIDKLKNVNLREKYADLSQRIKVYAKKVGRVAAKPLLIFYYVLKDESLSSKDKMIIYGCILYVISPVTIIPQHVFKLLGVMDEATAILIIIRRVRDKVTPEIIQKAEATLAEWFDESETESVTSV